MGSAAYAPYWERVSPHQYSHDVCERAGRLIGRHMHRNSANFVIVELRKPLHDRLSSLAHHSSAKKSQSEFFNSLKRSVFGLSHNQFAPDGFIQLLESRFCITIWDDCAVIMKIPNERELFWAWRELAGLFYELENGPKERFSA
jgi:hypothetical protein